MFNKKKQQSGVSLIEVLVSAVLISMIFLWISDTHMGSLTAIADTNNRNKAVWLAEEMIERIKVNPLLDSYKNEIDSAKNLSAYCRAPVRCTNRECTEGELVQYDVQQVLCNNADGFNELEMALECFDINTGRSITPCYKKGTLRGKITLTWLSKDPARGQLSAYSEVLFVINQSLYFDGSNDYLRAIGSLFVGDFTISMWVKPENNVSNYQGLFGKDDGGGIPRSPTLFISPGNGLAYDAYDSVMKVNRVLCIPPHDPICMLRPFIDVPLGADRYHDAGTAQGFFPRNQWTHVTWVRYGSEFVFYKNGNALVRRGGLPTGLHNKGDNWIGSVAGFPFRGELDDVQIYGSALSEAQILGVMEGHRFEDKSLLLHLDFEGDGFSSVIKDKSGLNRGVSSHGGINDNSRRHAVR